jgi:hypothetical protein
MLSITADRPISPIAAGHRPRRVLPVGARFPRTWPAPDLDQDTVVLRPEHHRARVFPEGRSAMAESVAGGACFDAGRPAFLGVPTEGGAVPSPSADRTVMPPVGARFPRRPRALPAWTVAVYASAGRTTC